MHDVVTRPDQPANDPLARRLAELRAMRPQPDVETISDVVRAVLSTMSGDLTATEASLLTEVEALGRTIANAKAEIAALRVDEITDNHIPFATDELDAIVAHTASATHAILASCEMLDEAAAELAATPAGTKLQDATTRIYEACSFQDITGQRITKVVSTLKTIEAKIEQIVATFGQRDDLGGDPSGAPGAHNTLLNGPQLPEHAMDQSDVDKLLASFDR